MTWLRQLRDALHQLFASRYSLQLEAENRRLTERVAQLEELHLQILGMRRAAAKPAGRPVSTPEAHEQGTNRGTPKRRRTWPAVTRGIEMRIAREAAELNREVGHWLHGQAREEAKKAN